MAWRFPEVKFVRTNTKEEQVGHILSEAVEVYYALLDKKGLDEEMADLLHSCETYFRIRQREGCDVHKVFSRVIEKNRKRGYYEGEQESKEAEKSCETCKFFTMPPHESCMKSWPFMISCLSHELADWQPGREINKL